MCRHKFLGQKEFIWLIKKAIQTDKFKLIIIDTLSYINSILKRQYYCGHNANKMIFIPA